MGASEKRAPVISATAQGLRVGRTGDRLGPAHAVGDVHDPVLRAQRDRVHDNATSHGVTGGIEGLELAGGVLAVAEQDRGHERGLRPVRGAWTVTRRAPRRCRVRARMGRRQVRPRCRSPGSRPRGTGRSRRPAPCHRRPAGHRAPPGPAPAPRWAARPGAPPWGTRPGPRGSRKLQNTGPSSVSNAPESVWQIRVPTRSPGTRSGVNWMRRNEASRASASVRIVWVLARPGTPSSSGCPPASRATRTRSSIWPWPTITRRISNRTASAVARIGKRADRRDGRSRPTGGVGHEISCARRPGLVVSFGTAQHPPAARSSQHAAGLV